jgi:hypothetical protein
MFRSGAIAATVGGFVMSTTRDARSDLSLWMRQPSTANSRRFVFGEISMKASLTSAVLIAMCGSALAQSAPAAAPAPVVAEAAPAPSVVVVNTTAAPAPENVRLQLSAEDRELIEDGEISTGAHIAGGALAFFVGFGVGQAVEGRWGSRGWIFTVGDTASLILVGYGLGKGASDCATAAEGETCGGSGLGLIAGGLIAYSGFRLWETIDAFVAPIGHNRRVRGAKLRAGMNPMYSATPYVVPAQNGNGAVGGLSLRF